MSRIKSKIEVKDGERGADATLVLNFGDTVVKAMDVTFRPPGDDRGLALLEEIVKGANALMNLSTPDGD